ncbi:MAG TPA: hypothetical protein VGK94_09280 [Candidatus Polarisedimenticolia bacterium]
MIRFLVVLLVVLCPGLAAAQGTTEVIEFNGFSEGDIVRDQYVDRGVRLPADPAGGPYIDDGGLLAFLLDTPPGLLSLNPLAGVGGPGVVHASVGTYVFDFVDPTNRFAASYTDYVEVVVAFPDAGVTVLTAYDASGNVLGTDQVNLFSSSFFTERLRVYAPGIQKATVTTPLVQPTIGALVDTLIYDATAVIPARTIEIDVRPGSRRNQIRLGDRSTVPVAILSEPGFQPALIDPGKVLFQKASPESYSIIDRNHDRVPDMILNFRVIDLQNLTPASTTATLTAVDVDGTPLTGSDSVLVQDASTGPPVP